MMTPKNTIYFLVPIGVVAALLAITWFAVRQSPLSFVPFSSYRQNSLFLSPSDGEIVTTIKGQTTSSSRVISSSGSDYAKMVLAFQGRRVELNEICKATPFEATFKSGTSVMFDNRSGDGKTVRVGNTSYFISGYSYRIVNLRYPDVPQTMLIDCNKAQNVARIITQR